MKNNSLLKITIGSILFLLTLSIIFLLSFPQNNENLTTIPRKTQLIDNTDEYIAEASSKPGICESKNLDIILALPENFSCEETKDPTIGPILEIKSENTRFVFQGIDGNDYPYYVDCPKQECEGEIKTPIYRMITRENGKSGEGEIEHKGVQFRFSGKDTTQIQNILDSISLLTEDLPSDL